jgi:hypothetical protein
MESLSTIAPAIFVGSIWYSPLLTDWRKASTLSWRTSGEFIAWLVNAWTEALSDWNVVRSSVPPWASLTLLLETALGLRSVGSWLIVGLFTSIFI